MPYTTLFRSEKPAVPGASEDQGWFSDPCNPVGWILICATLLLTLSTDAAYYAVLYDHLGHQGLPLAPVAVLLVPFWVPAVALFPLVILLFRSEEHTSEL